MNTEHRAAHSASAEGQGVRLKVLISAFACEPGWGSEQEVGWRWAVQAARFHEVWVITHASQRSSIESELRARPLANLHFEYVAFPAWTNASGITAMVLRLQYLLWQFKAFWIARRLTTRVRFDVAHHLTYASFRYPTFLAWLDIPFVWGPLGGGDRAPKAFYQTYGKLDRWLETLRDASNWIANADPTVRISAARAARVLALTQNTLNMMTMTTQQKALVIPNIAVDPSLAVEGSRHRTTSRSTRLLYLGRLEYLKGPQLAVPALAKSIEKGADVTLTIVGDGPLRAHIEELTEVWKVQDHVKFGPRVPRDQVPVVLAQHDVLIFPSFRDSGGYVGLEAMAASLPVICLNLGGPADTVTDETGIRVSTVTPDQAIDDLSDAISRLADNADLRRQLGSAGRCRAVTVYSWDNIGTFLRTLYADVLEPGS